MSTTQNILNSAKKIYNTPMAPNIHHGLGIGGAAVTTAISYRFILKNIIEASSLSPVAQKRVKVILPTGMFATGVAVHLIAGKVASQVTLIAIAITSLIIGKVLARRKATAQAQLAKDAAIALKKAKRSNEAFVDANDPSKLDKVSDKASIFKQEIAKQATASEAEKKEAEKKAKLANGREPSSPKGAPASTTESTSSTSKIVRTVSASKADTTNTNGSTQTPDKSKDSTIAKVSTIGSQLGTPPPSNTSSTTETPKAKESETNGKTTPPKTKETASTATISVVPTSPKKVKGPKSASPAQPVAPIVGKAVDATRYIFTIQYTPKPKETPSNVLPGAATMGAYPQDTPVSKIIVNESVRGNSRSIEALSSGVESENIEERTRIIDLIVEEIQLQLNGENIVLATKGKNVIDPQVRAAIFAGNFISIRSLSVAEEIRAAIRQKIDLNFFNIERLFQVIEGDKTIRSSTLISILGCLKAEDQAQLLDKLFASTKKYNDKFLSGKLLAAKNVKEFALPTSADAKQIKDFMELNPEISRLSLTKAQFEVAYRIVVEKGEKNLYILGIPPNLMTQEHLDLVANSKLNSRFKNVFQLAYGKKADGNKSEEKKADEKKDETVKS